jgi:hypothetical protein
VNLFTEMLDDLLVQAGPPSTDGPGCGVSSHDADCLCDIVVTEPTTVRFTPDQLLYGNAVADYVGLDSLCDPHALADFLEVYGVLWEAHWGTALRCEAEAKGQPSVVQVGKGHRLTDAFSVEDRQQIDTELRAAADNGIPFSEVARKWGFPAKSIYDYAAVIGVEPKPLGVETDPQYAELCDDIALLLSHGTPYKKVREIVDGRWPRIPGSKDRSDYTRFRNTCVRIMEQKGLPLPEFRKKK